MTSRNIALVVGTRPEAIKVAPLVAPLEASKHLVPSVILSGQHGTVVDDVFRDFGVDVGSRLIGERDGDSLPKLGSQMLATFGQEFERTSPDLVVVHGDTATAYVAALAAYWLGLPIAHLEAGLRSDSMTEPFPEEFHRVSIDMIADLCLAPTQLSADHLFDAGVARDRVHITGNTVVDALRYTLSLPFESDNVAVKSLLASEEPIVLATAHRRESWGDPMEEILSGVREIATSEPDANIAFALHPNPLLRDLVCDRLGSTPNIALLEPLAYRELAHLLQASDLVVTDSGGLQEEACALGTPTLILRDRTERPEAVTAGIASLVGADRELIAKTASERLRDAVPSREVDVFGDGHASERSCHAMEYFFGLGRRPAAFQPRFSLGAAAA